MMNIKLILILIIFTLTHANQIKCMLSKFEKETKQRKTKQAEATLSSSNITDIISTQNQKNKYIMHSEYYKTLRTPQGFKLRSGDITFARDESSPKMNFYLYLQGLNK